ncbi:MAG: hypothetical protein ACKVYV_01035 [Limisphaerales bacterium]
MGRTLRGAKRAADIPALKLASGLPSDHRQRRPDGMLTRDQVLAQLCDRDWKLPATTATTPTLGELFVTYRADRFREYGNRRNAMPQVPARATP